MAEDSEPDAEPSPNPARFAPVRVVLPTVASVVIVIYMAVDAILTRLLWPTIAQLSRLMFFQQIGEAIARLPPYAVLVLLAVPFILIEPVKVFALYWLASGHFVQGALLLVAAYVLSVLICDRIYHSGHAKLMQIGWFKRLMDWLIGLRSRGVAWAKSQPVWVAVSRTVSNLRRRIIAVWRTIG